MNQTAKNYDSVTPIERARVERRSRRARQYRRFFFWPGALAGLCLLLMAYSDVRHRDAMVALKETHASEVAKLKAEIALRKGEPTAQKCTDYLVHMEGWSLTHCTEPRRRGI